MSHEFKCFTMKKGKTVSVPCSAFAPGITGTGEGGIILNIPTLNTIPDREFAELVAYWLENTDLVAKDPRLTLLSRIDNMGIKKGYNGPRSRRIVLGERP